MKKKLLFTLCLCMAVATLFAVVGCKKKVETTYDYNGGELYDGEPYKKGYDFVGWVGEDGEIVTDTEKYKGTTLTARWTEKRYHLEFETVTMAGGIYGYDADLIYGEEYDFTSFIRDGYECDGINVVGYDLFPLKGTWDFGSDRNLKKDLSGVYNLKVDYSNLRPKTYHITYNLNGGEFTDAPDNKYSVEDCPSEQQWDIDVVYKKGYTFTYWSLDEAGEEKVEKPTELKSLLRDVDLYANYEVGKYTFWVKGATDNDSREYTLTYGEDYSFPVQSKSGKSFAGYLLPDCVISGKHLDSVVIPAKGKFYYEYDGAATVYPYFRDYQFVYNLNGGTNDEENPLTVTGDEEVTLKSATKANMTFEGWYSDSAFTKAVTKISAEDIKNGDFNLYAKFSGKKVTATLDFDGGKCEAFEKKTVTYHYNTPGTSSKTKVVEVETGKALEFYYPYVESRYNYAFKGWYKDKACTIPYNYDEPITMSFDLYAGFYKLPSLTSPIYYNAKYTINPYDYSIVDGEVLAKKTISNSMSGYPVCLCFTAEYDGEYKIHYQGTTSSASSRLYIYNLTQDNKSYSMTHTYPQFDAEEHVVTIEAKKGDFIAIELQRKLTTDREGRVATFSFWFEGNFTKPESTAIATEGATVILEYGTPVNIPSPVKEGYTFVGWQKADGTMLDPEAEWDIPEDTTLKAIYKPNDDNV